MNRDQIKAELLELAREGANYQKEATAWQYEAKMENGLPGHSEYAFRQSEIYNNLYNRSFSRFKTLLEKL